MTFASTRFLLGDFSPLEILVLRFSIAFAALWIVTRFTGKVDCGGWRSEWIFAAMGLSGIVVYQFLENCAIRSMNASSVAIVVAFGPIVTALLARALTYNEQFSARFVCGSLIAVAGVAICEQLAKSVIYMDEPEKRDHNVLMARKKTCLRGVRIFDARRP